MPGTRGAAALLLGSTLLLVGCAAPAATAPIPAPSPTVTVIVVRTPPLLTTTIDLGAPGPSVGDMRTWSGPATVEGSDETGTFDGYVITTRVDDPTPGMEARIGHIVIALGPDGDQVSISGLGMYDTTSPTLPVGVPTRRAIAGGAGRFAAARGWAVSTHLEEGGWRHELHLVTGG